MERQTFMEQLNKRVSNIENYLEKIGPVEKLFERIGMCHCCRVPLYAGKSRRKRRRCDRYSVLGIQQFSLLNHSLPSTGNETYFIQGVKHDRHIPYVGCYKMKVLLAFQKSKAKPLS